MTWIVPDWPAPPGVRALVTTRDDGAGAREFNLAASASDDASANRRRLLAATGIGRIQWLHQVHGTDVVELPAAAARPRADAAVTAQCGLGCAVLTADCLPVLFCDRAGRRVGAAHAGWRGLAAGVLEATVAALGDAGDLLVWLGPAIGPARFEVGGEVRQCFVERPANARLRDELAAAFTPQPGGDRYCADLYALARAILAAAGVGAVYGGGECTYTDHRFYSWRRDGASGRFASVIWRKEPPFA